MIKIAICDDDQGLAAQLEKLLYKHAQTKRISVCIDLFYDGFSLVQYMETEVLEYDLLFLDIEMEKMNGMETAARIREKNQEMLLIFVTSHTQYAIAAYAVRPFQFLVKPLQEEMVCNYFQQAYEWIVSGEVYFEYQYGKEYYRIFMKDILYFESDKRTIHIHLRNGSKRQYYDKIHTLEKKLKNTKMDFWRIHQSLLVNAKYVVRKAFDHLELCDGTILSISAGRRKELNMYYIKKMTQLSGTE